MELQELCQRFDERLDTAAYAEIDASANGLQVGPDEATIDHAAFAVDAALATIESAADLGADLLVTHHGLSWGGFDRVTGQTYDRIQALIDEEIALYVSHLPLDGHQELGNAAKVADRLGVEDRSPFGSIGPEHAGTKGTLTEATTAEAIAGQLEASLPTGGSDVQVLKFGPEEITAVGIVTGSGVDWIEEAADGDLDLLVTGEGKQQAYHDAREAGVSVVLAGHYATETGGVKSLQSLAEDWGLETSYIEHPTGL